MLFEYPIRLCIKYSFTKCSNTMKYELGLERADGNFEEDKNHAILVDI